MPRARRVAGRRELVRRQGGGCVAQIGSPRETNLADTLICTDDKHFPLNEALPLLPRLKILHVSGALISPAALEIPSVALSHLFVHACPAWTPSAVHSALSKMSHDPPAVERLTLPVMADARARGGSRRAGADEPGSSDGWTETWRFTVRKTGEAKGCSVKASMEEHDAEAGRAQVVDSDSE